MTITIHELIPAICPDSHAEVSFWREMRQTKEAGDTEVEAKIYVKILRPLVSLLPRQAYTEAFSELKLRLHIPIPQPSSPGDYGQAALARCGGLSSDN